MVKRILSAVLIGSGALLVVAALVLGGYNLWDDSRAGSEMDSVLDQIKQIIPSSSDSSDPSGSADPAPSSPGDSSGTTDPGVSDSPEEGDLPFIPDYILNPNMDMPAVEINGHRYIGIVTIPALDLELPIMEDWDYVKLKIAPCRYKGSVYTNTLIVAAHNYTTHFGRLKNLQAGDSVIFTDIDGNVFRYSVVYLETLAKTAVTEMESGEWDLTLFTCTIGGKTRVTVRCMEDK